jgi:general nucleoside transport system permease protein
MSKLLRIVYLLKSVWAILAALLVGSVIILLGGADPLEAYSALFTGAFFDYHGLATTLVKMSPILLAGLAVALPLRAGQFNIGAEGQIYLGALFATWAALYLPEMPGWMHISVASLAGMLGGALWGFIPGYLKAVHKANEVIVTLLMNYIGINLVSYFVSGPMLEEGAPYPYSVEIRQELWLPIVLPGSDAHLGVVVGIVLAIVLFFVFRRTAIGLSLSTVGHNPHAARYAGMSVKRYVMLSLTSGGALAGLAGAFEVLGLKYRLFHLFSPGYGFDGIVVALLAEANPLWVAVASLFLGGLRSGANIMQRAVGVPTTAVEAITGLILIFVAASLVFRYETSYLAVALRRRKAVAAALDRERDEDAAA